MGSASKFIVSIAPFPPGDAGPVCSPVQELEPLYRSLYFVAPVAPGAPQTTNASSDSDSHSTSTTFPVFITCVEFAASVTSVAKTPSTHAEPSQRNASTSWTLATSTDTPRSISFDFGLAFKVTYVGLPALLKLIVAGFVQLEPFQSR
ncbi:MAG: hypothetical protein A3A43_00975 [Candidatus Liptonbacteria bacterium RIFCSPLOWO2_01_FULL_56_20]|uniref:Uncharacterized protein n=1 Tax=Candidatus Liptonbacteria bacterium RIFCSPLOWO2_01_FULL_56_20 TaxID=1798652 RepID=A0A1G2CM63_9BACT|nr:MAG: hypothetical protein A2681_02915 [Candidatus Liptonbacteria bacterium RIFCSPHIGHO2_01_FULL_56_18b]OGZ01731.1 MAG: hypothetical protein A3A43_00975 [Candidatus Liptonbacteria bacterium RIFCSPLOWO2_01_FULL_56_20]